MTAGSQQPGPDGAYVGARVPRREDPRLLTGQGAFVDDLEIPGVLHAAMVRSPYAHARILHVDATRARALPGVMAAISAEDVPDLQLPWPARMPSPVPGTTLHHGRRFTLPDKVRHVGEVVAVVVGVSRAIAEDGCDLVEVEYEPLPVVGTVGAALEPGAPRVYEELADNVAAHIVQRVGDPEEAFATASHTLRETLRMVRGGGHSMEGRAVAARYDESLDSLTVWDSTQAPHAVRTFLAFLLGMSEHRIRVICPPDVGGGFGPKASQYPEEALVAWLARRLRQPVKWIEDRYEHFISAAQEREQVHTVEIAFDDDGKLRGLRDVFTHDLGMWGALVVPVISACTVPGPYKIPNIHSELTAAYTNLQPTSAVRGAGRPQGLFVMERMMDRMAEVLGLDPAEVRIRNLIPADEFPYAVGMWFRDGAPLTYDSGNYPELLRRALELADYPRAARREQTALRAQGICRGIGIAIGVEGVGLGPFEGAVLRLDNRGRVVVAIGAPPQGQGYETAFAQTAADAVGVRYEDVDVVTGDTGQVPYGIGTFASRVTANAGPAVLQAGAELREKILAAAAHALGEATEDLEIAEGTVRLRGAPQRSVPLAQVARLGNAGTAFGMVMPGGLVPGLEASAYFTPAQAGYAASCHVCILDVDPETGEVAIVRYIVGHDCGPLINPLIVEGQIIGGVAHGLSNALYEEAIFDDQGQSLAASFLDYPIPSAREMPRLELFHLSTPSPLNPLGVKGAGEAGTLPVPAAIANAVEDALRGYGVRVNRMPLNPARISDLVQGGRVAQDTMLRD